MKIVIITLVLVAVWAPLAISQPELEIPNNDYTFGSVPQNSTVKQGFWFKSVGTDTLVIKEVKTGCSCVMVPLPKDRLAPGDSMLVEFIWDTERRLGQIHRYPYIFTNAKEDAYRVFLSAGAVPAMDSIKPVSVRPFKCELAVSSVKAVDSVALQFTNHSEEDLSVKIVSRPVEECAIVMPQEIPAGGQAKGYVTVRPEYRQTEFKESVTVEFGNESNTRMTIPIRRKIY